MKKNDTVKKGMSTLFFLIIFLQFSHGIKAQNSKSGAQGPQNVLKLGPMVDNPRNSEGDFIELKDGRVLYIYTHYYGNSSSDHGTAYLASRVSNDRGNSWSKEDELVLKNEGALNVMSVSLLRLQSGKIALFYLKKNSDSDCIPTLRLSGDEAKTWGDPIACVTDREGYFVLNNDRVIQDTDGRLFFAVSQHNIPNGEFTGKGVVYCYYSNDEGRTWQSGEAVPNPDHITFQEPGLVFLNDNSLLMFIRTDLGTQLYSKSIDSGKTWGEVYKSQLISPVSPATIERIPSTGDLLAVWNNNLSTNEKLSKQRIPLNIAVSKDEGVSWQNIKIIDGNPEGWFCYTAMQFVDNSVLLGYCAGTKSAHLTESHVTKVDLEWIYQ
ncbi:glycoside hydrolase [Flavobacteriaceae bacterium F89]|uniref:Glycoside hydrolase n=1 Tax=Cerina litoralis TaxID=2874477 RepID=A0AAE3EYC1_9FLAO|nr:sialidase family protein [Cerina litoralis]MCG2461977.1 glycoside hydrolase [Cerina litoralis]